MKKIVFVLMALVVGLSACDRNFEEINTNPNDPTTVPNTNILLSSLISGMDRIHGASMNMTYAGLWVQHYAKIQYIDEDRYAYRPSAIDAHWTGLYAGPLFDLQNIIDNATADEPNMKAAAMTLKAYYLSVVTDCWGMAPFAEALQGATNLSPVYDSQDAIYAGLESMLAEANGMFDASADDLGVGDIMFNSDIDKWQRFCNSLRVRLLVRTSGANAGALAEAGTILASQPVMMSNADNAGFSYVGDATYSNPIYENKYVDGRDDHAMSEPLINLMNTGGFSSVMDPRLPIYAETNDDGDYVGQPNGTIEPSDFGQNSRIGAAFRDTPTAPVYGMTYADLLFLSAEINQSKADYLAAIAASHDQHGASADQTYLADADAAWDANWQQALGEQKWIALFGNGVEAFAEARRLDFPVLVEAGRSVYPGQGVPVRFPYASTENLTNGTNLGAAESAQGVGATGLFARVWWDVN